MVRLISKAVIPVKKGKVFGQAFFKRLAGRGAEPHKNTTCAPKKVNCEIVLLTISQ